MEETAQNFEKRFFYKQILNSIFLPKFYVTHRNFEILSKSLVPTPHTIYLNTVHLDILLTLTCR
jgi:hypothetical protein